MTPEENKKFGKYLQPQCLSLYNEQWPNGEKGCLFFDGQSLCIIDAFWRKDDQSILYDLHQTELNMIREASTEICNGDAARIVSALLSLHNQDRKCFILDLGDFIKIFEKDYDERDLLEGWLHVLESQIIKCYECSSDDNSVICMMDFAISKFIKCDSTCSNIQHFSHTFMRGILSNQDLVLQCFEPNAKFLNNQIAVHCISTAEHWRESVDVMGIVRETTTQVLGISACIVTKALLAKNERSMNIQDWRDFLYLTVGERYVDGAPRTASNPDYIRKLLQEDRFNCSKHDEKDLKILYPYYYAMSLDTSKDELFKEYLDTITPVWINAAEKNPHFTEDFASSPVLLHSLMLLVEKQVLEYSQHSLLWNSLYESERLVLTQYANRYMAFLQKTKGASIQVIEDYLVREHLTVLDLIPSLAEQLAAPAIEDSTTINNDSHAPEEIHWPDAYYTATATDEAKQVYESYLKSLCDKKTRSMTRDIKKYIAQKEQAKIIMRPSQTEEYEIVCSFGYDKSLKTYLNCVV